MASPEDIATVQAAAVSFDLEAWEAEKGEYAEAHWRYLNYAFEIETYSHMFSQAERDAARRLIEEYETAQTDHQGTYVDESAALIASADAFTRQYIASALWTGVELPYGDDRADSGGAYDLEEDSIIPATLRDMIEDCATFQRDNADTLAKAYESDVYIQGERYNASNAGHDFWLTRNGHGAGFWDRGLEEVGEALTKACKAFGEYYLAMSDNGEISKM
ncbi:hypothetical protein CcrC1_gp535 [Caulobacter phage C1]|nr:hypothetical protein CcrC1_gp042 [Caulobacter phage C1]UTU08269.1 hypothetical protein CcrC2_gp041 [Caulobacter phage C2]UTU08792.1 hypothetical protein CcrJ4_gp041 [Caulobacter phage J4]UTU09904.1 hypothetical protein CcrRB23_gp042 [Caulobacter phage RB23]WGN96929.1 phage protein Pham177 [Bertelyvirus sp.]